MSPAAEYPTIFKNQTLAEWCSDHNEPFKMLQAQSRVVGRIPTKIENKYLPAFSPPIFYGRITDSIILPSKSFNCTPDGALICQGLSHRDYAIADDLEAFFVEELPGGYYRLNIPPEIPVVEQECIFLGGRNNFGHLVFENLFRWAVGVCIPNSATLPVAVYAGLPSRFYEFFDLLGLPAERRILIDPSIPTRFRRVWRVSNPMYQGESGGQRYIFWSPESVQYIHDQVRARAGVAAPPLEKQDRPILYAARGGEAWRRLLNEAEIIECVEKYGGTPATFHGLSAQDQVRLVGNARALILPVGAASAISVFAPRDCVIIELVAPNIKAFFGPMAYAGCLGQPHFRVRGRNATEDEVQAAGLTITSKILIDADYWIDRGSLDATLKSALAEDRA